MSRGQVDYGQPAAQLLGMLEQSGIHYDASGVNVDASPMRFGLGVKLASPVAGARGRVQLVSALTDKLAGITGFHHTYDRLNELDSATGGVLTNVDIALRRVGVVSVLCDAAASIVEGDLPYCRVVAGAGGTILGTFRAAPVAAETIDVNGIGYFVRGHEDTPFGRLAKLYLTGAGWFRSSVSTAQDVGSVTFSVGAKVSTTITVGVQLLDVNGQNSIGNHEITAWLSDTAGGAVSGTAADGGIAVSGTGAILLKTDTAGLLLRAMTGTTGALNLAVTHSGTHSWFLNVSVDGIINSSTVLAF